MDLIEQLVRDEGLRNHPYTDTVGKLTIGVGRNLTDVGLYDEEIKILLQNDIGMATAQLTKNFAWFSTLDEIRAAALTNMTFNLGITRLLGFHNFLAAMERHDWQGAAAAMLDSLWAREVGDRAKRLAQQVTTGEWT